MMKRVGFTKFILAVALIVGGIFILLANLDVISLEMWQVFSYSYPFILLAIGIKFILDSLFGKGDRWPLGLITTVFAAFLVMDRFGWMTFTAGDIWLLWPLLLVLIGVRIFTSKGTKPKVEIRFDDEHDSEDFKRKKSAIGDYSFTNSDWSVEPMNLWNAVGDYKFDFTKAFIPEKDTPFKLSGVVGDVKILMPENVAFRIEASVKTGDIRILDQKADGLNRVMHYQTPDYGTATRKVTFYVDFKVGNIRLDRV
ncbi:MULTISPECIES: cell wall-active antibiotics response protein LiaF [Pontibacillus]|uniref:Cell wall-active antibiotics response protein LiaF n=1 Tax=Pontibacillus chungwhensis TaxID=265426 RepID=A0ABY8V0A7_9BACI|nr:MULTISPECIES: cell wall-active antibiotics response protein LiaF [Pontibacillus]MCD5324976.1 cell wall-active antibiotics response protein LiaF [Pontibacillus sp. HN14]WIF98933.1 cell wall-active antibiotics response protein LiaF [Pontibacillus chungwhensis]